MCIHTHIYIYIYTYTYTLLAIRSMMGFDPTASSPQIHQPSSPAPKRLKKRELDSSSHATAHTGMAPST